jgi:hypothetical protein
MVNNERDFFANYISKTPEDLINRMTIAVRFYLQNRKKNNFLMQN